jgi:hypothetical protein
VKKRENGAARNKHLPIRRHDHEKVLFASLESHSIKRPLLEAKRMVARLQLQGEHCWRSHVNEHHAITQNISRFDVPILGKEDR